MKRKVDSKWILTRWFDAGLFSTGLTQIGSNLPLIRNQLLSIKFSGQCLVVREPLGVFYFTYKAHIVFRTEYQKKGLSHDSLTSLVPFCPVPVSVSRMFNRALFSEQQLERNLTCC